VNVARNPIKDGKPIVDDVQFVEEVADVSDRPDAITVAAVLPQINQLIFRPDQMISRLNQLISRICFP
jgi:hypothetical protein